jgi:hypothetical protein
VDGIVREPTGAGDMGPGQLPAAAAAHAGLVAVQHGRAPQRGLDRRLHRLDDASSLLHPGNEASPSSKPHAEQVCEQVLRATEWHEVHLHSIHRQRRSRGPYWARLVASGGNVPPLTCPQRGQRRYNARCSVKPSRSVGSSCTCRRSRRTTGAASSATCQCAPTSGQCSSTALGIATSRSVSPGCPSCPPAFFPLRFRSSRSGGLAEQAEHGCMTLEERNTQLEAENAKLREQVTALLACVQELEG